MSKFEVGDRVKTKYSTYPGIYTIRSVNKDGLYLRYYIEGYPTSFLAGELEPFTPETPTKTDEELATEYRAIAAKAREIGLELESRGYIRQWKAPHRNVYDWKNLIRLGPQADVVRFIKNETVTEMKPVTKTVTKEI